MKKSIALGKDVKIDELPVVGVVASDDGEEFIRNITSGVNTDGFITVKAINPLIMNKTEFIEVVINTNDILDYGQR